MRAHILSQTAFTYEYEGDLDEIKRVLEEFPLTQNAQNYASVPSYVLDMPELSELRLWTEQKIAETLIELNYSFGLRITQSWSNKTDKGRWHHRHAHSNSLMSGIFYVTPSNSYTWFSTQSIWPSDKGDSDSGAFLPMFGWGAPRYQEIIHKFPTTPGTLILFPSALEHSVDNHELDDPRYSIAFNTFPVGTFGNERTFTSLELNG